MATSSLASQANTGSVVLTQEIIDSVIAHLQSIRDIASAPGPLQLGTAPPGASMKVTKKQRETKGKRDVGKGPKRPLNSWMAFRKFYAGSLAPHTQKTISKILTLFWHEDPFGAKWAILAKAYSTLRGNLSKEMVPLQDFFDLCTRKMGIVSAKDYQRVMGWVVAPAMHEGEEPRVRRIFVPDLSTFPEEFLSTTCSAEDLVEHCIESGFGVDGGDGNTGGRNGFAASTHIALSMAVNPNTADAEAEKRRMAEASHKVVEENMKAALRPRVPPTQAERDLANFNEGLELYTDAEDHETHGGVHADMYFDPTWDMDVSFDPAAGLFQDGVPLDAAFDAFDIAGVVVGTEEAINESFDINEFFDVDGGAA